MRCLIVASLVLCCSFAQADELQDAYDQYEALYEQGKYQEALPFAEEAVRLTEVEFGNENELTGQRLNEIGYLLYCLGDYKKSEESLKRSLEVCEKALGPDHPDVATALNNLADLYIVINSDGDYTEEEALLKRSLDIREKSLGTDHPDVAKSLISLSNLHIESNYLDEDSEYQKAEELLKRALNIRETALGPDHPDVAESLDALGYLFEGIFVLNNGEGDYEKAEDFFKRALDIYEKALGPDHPNVAETLLRLGGMYYYINNQKKRR